MEETPRNRDLDLEGLKALAHPLRVQIVDVLSTYGSFTASGLAERLGESSGATSYHLRQLEKHGFVREVEGKGTGRERWWERVPGGISIQPRDIRESPAAQAASRIVLKQWQRTREDLLNNFLDRSIDETPPHWLDASTTATANTRMTSEQLGEFVKDFEKFLNERLPKYRGKTPPGSRPVQIQFNAFPIMDAEETPLAEEETQ